MECLLSQVGEIQENVWFLGLLAILPAIVLCVYIYHKDRVEKEPLGLLVLLFGAGAVSCLPALLLEMGVSPLLDGVFAPFGKETADGVALSPLVYKVYCAVDAFIGVALMEELCKWCLLVLLTRKNNNFNCTFDGIVYAVFVTLGFAALENVMYVFQYGFETGLLRAVTSVPGHMFFGVLMGAQYSLWRLATEAHTVERAMASQGMIGMRDPINPNAHAARSLLFPILIHGFYDFCLFTGDLVFVIIFYVSLAGMYLYCFSKIRQLSKHDGDLRGYAVTVVQRKYGLIPTAFRPAGPNEEI